MSNKQNVNKDKIPLAPFRLADVRLFEVCATRCDEGKTDKVLEFTTELASSEIDKGDNSFSLKLSVKTSIPDGEDSICNLELSIQGRFEAVVDIQTIREEALEDFKSRTGVFLLWLGFNYLVQQS